MTERKFRVIQYGIGPIGLKMIEYLAERPTFELVGAVDIDPAKIGRDVGELAGLPNPLGIKVSGNAAELLKETEADAVVLTTSSSLNVIRPQVLEIVSYGKSVVSSCEELMFPWHTQPAIAREIDEAAERNNVSVLATGVNPGFLMDFLPLVLTGICRNVKKITVERIQDAQFRRLPFQKKIGAGLTPEEFDAKVKEGVLRHVGLTESIHLIASGLGWQLDRAEDIISPVIAKKKVVSPDITVEPGQATGVSQIGRGYRDGKEVITLIFQASIGEPSPRERIAIEGAPNIELSIDGGVNGDVATCAIIANAIPVLVGATPGLRTMADVRAIPCTA
jgi:4-hydroxy-tetrahydrodipicolinate reductase